MLLTLFMVNYYFRLVKYKFSFKLKRKSCQHLTLVNINFTLTIVTITILLVTPRCNRAIILTTAMCLCCAYLLRYSRTRLTESGFNYDQRM